MGKAEQRRQPEGMKTIAHWGSGKMLWLEGVCRGLEPIGGEIRVNPRSVWKELCSRAHPLYAFL